MYILKTMGGERFKITDEEFAQIGDDAESVYIKSCDAWVNMSSVSTIFPESKADEIEDRRERMTGRLHDGTRVRKHFGEWIMADTNEIVKIDPQYYPEIIKDQVFTENEWENIKHLSLQERAMLVSSEDKKQLTSEITKQLCEPSKKSKKK